MNLLIVGSGQGSWTMRGRQLGGALGARVTSNPSSQDFGWADVIVLVKRALTMWGQAAQRSGKAIVWDALDFWRQPSQNILTEESALALIRAQVAFGPPMRVIGATRAMAKAIDGVYLPHHSWLGLQPTPARAHVRTVAYQGGEVYLGRWAGWVRQACAVRGWTFTINPPDLSAADLIVAFRDESWDGWMCREWKSGVKIVNAIAAGRPLITQDSAAWRELQPTGSVVESPAALDAAFETWAGENVRADVVAWCADRAPAFTLESVATQYRGILETRGLACA